MAGNNSTPRCATGQRVAVFRQDGLAYPRSAPFHPPVIYPEYPYRPAKLDAENQVYAAVRQTLLLLGLDAEKYGRPDWNPLGGLIHPGNRVLIKPNLVRSYNPGEDNLDGLVTHASIIRVLLDFAIIALQGEGSIVVGDAPLQDCDLDKLIELTGLDAVVEFCQANSGLPIELADFRLAKAVKDHRGVVKERWQVEGDGERHRVVDLGQSSYLAALGDRFQNFRVTNYNPQEMIRHHNKTTHEYLIARQVLEADVIINLPKLKTHRKAGISVALKNMVGINGSKDWLPHHSVGALCEQGDEYRHPSRRKKMLSRLLDKLETSPSYAHRALGNLLCRGLRHSGSLRRFRDEHYEGSWHGNDTLWRTILDLNRIVFFADASGKINLERPARRYLALVDGVVAGDGEGPLEPRRRPLGLLAAGFNPVSLDTCCALLMGFDPCRIATLRQGWQDAYLGYDPDWHLLSNSWPNREALHRNHCNFLPSKGWQELLRPEIGSNG